MRVFSIYTLYLLPTLTGSPNTAKGLAQCLRVVSLAWRSSRYDCVRRRRDGQHTGCGRDWLSNECWESWATGFKRRGSDNRCNGNGVGEGDAGRPTSTRGKRSSWNLEEFAGGPQRWKTRIIWKTCILYVKDGYCEFVRSWDDWDLTIFIILIFHSVRHGFKIRGAKASKLLKIYWTF